ncbi:ornithine carbamoyltransferase [Pontibacillus yanchengensis]|uniref:Ornithine carbamoyltransferase n=1 Tax=Pontibacillus yanchengensis TaxID=462910 RepID=A0A6I5A202_9BACI|nr:ornithine carbamoyltransferase [Pontibacillus yanchengensis]MYL34613.1 ornithine carbamoyltransferase [Pontibacillus yanchengensis]
MSSTQASPALYNKGVNENHFLTIGEWSIQTIEHVLEQAQVLKEKQQNGILQTDLNGKILGMIFEKSSTRTRVSFEAGMLQLGGDAINLKSDDLQLGRGETVEDTAKVLSQYVDVLMIRTFGHETIEQFAEAADIPVINGLTDLHHPTQVMADLLTIKEKKGALAGVKVAYVGDGNNMAHSFIEAASKMGMHLSVASPSGYEPDKSIVQEGKALAEQTGGSITITNNAKEAVTGADVITTDVWASMGQEEQQQERLDVFSSFQVNEDLCAYAKEDYVFMHCLPAHRGEEVTADIIDGVHSVVFEEAQNRLHAQKAILTYLLLGH